LSDDGIARVTPAGGTLQVDLKLMTRVLDGKETIDITNRADLFGDGEDPIYWSEIESRASSFGAESETRKHVSDRLTNGGEWTQLMVDDLGLGDVVVYRLEFIGPPGFGGVQISDEKDMLPAGLEFVGFVDEADVATGENPMAGPVDTAGNLEASFDPAAGPQGTITLSQKPGTQLPSGATADVYFAARIVDDSRVVVNDFGMGHTDIVPGGPSIDIEKWIDEGATPEYDADGVLTNDGYRGDYDAAPGKSLDAHTEYPINFTISNDGPEPLIDIAVSDQLDSGVGVISDLVCTFPDQSTGTEWPGALQPGEQFDCTGTLPELKSGQNHADTASVTAVGEISGQPVDDADEWHAHVRTELETTGGRSMLGLSIIGGLALIGGGFMLMRRRAN